MKSLGISYQFFVTIKLRCELDLNPQSVSMARLLTDIRNHPGEISREQFVFRYLAQTDNRMLPTGKTASMSPWLPDRDTLSQWSRAAHLRFDELVGDGQFGLTKEHVSADLNRLKDLGAKAKNFANRRVAHNDLFGSGPAPQSGSVEDWVRLLSVDPCIELLQSLFVKYWWLVNGEAPVGFPM